MLEDKKWSCYFRDFVFPYGFYGPEEYRKWLKNTGFIVKRPEMNSKDMALVGKESLPQEPQPGTRSHSKYLKD